MGDWGTTVFSNDFACDIRDNYNDLLINGDANWEATKKYLKCSMRDVRIQNMSLFLVSIGFKPMEKRKNGRRN